MNSLLEMHEGSSSTLELPVLSCNCYHVGLLTDQEFLQCFNILGLGQRKGSFAERTPKGILD